MKKRMVAAYNLQQSGVLAPGEPIKVSVKIPENATPLCMRISPAGDFVLFCEVWSHPEGTKVRFRDIEFAVVAPGGTIPAGSWNWYETLSAGVQIFHVYLKGKFEAKVVQ
jgi:hypothetical protein